MAGKSAAQDAKAMRLQASLPRILKDFELLFKISSFPKHDEHFDPIGMMQELVCQHKDLTAQ
jgi:hypothetical protein